MDSLDLFNPDGTFKRIVLPCPRSRKTKPQDLSVLNEELSKAVQPLDTGVSYVKEYIEKEEKELFETASIYSKNGQSNFDIVSQATMPCVEDIDNERLTRIYKMYNFAYRPKANLTITSMKDQIVSMVETNSVTVIQGPTGCGKTTQVPQFILDSCYKKSAHCNIIVTQPRRIAAMSIAKRVSQERDWPVGTLVGYQVGLINNTSRDTRLTYCTTGVLLHKLINAKNMTDYTHIILDEVHERNQDMDFLLLVVRKLLRTNSRTVRVVLMSATFEVDRFAKYFSSPVGNKLVPAPIIDIAKRNYYMVANYYLCQMGSLGSLPEVSATEPKVSRKMMEFCINLVIVLDEVDMNADDANCDAETGLYERHVILIFLPGIHEIEEMHGILSLPKHEKSKWDVVVLHSSITNEEQQRIFQKPPKGHRRIILSTNIAESSITVPDVKYVIDFCLTKQLVTDPRTNFKCLELAWASKTNCDQRAGRTGRVMDGRVYRLVPQRFYETVLPREGEPEMLRAPLENLVLKAKILDMGEPKAILALSLDPPDLSNLERTILLLKEAGALLCRAEDTQYLDGELTDLGRIMAHLPLDIHITKLIMLGHVFNVLRETIIIAASMTVKDMFCNPFQQKLLAYKVKLSWAANSCSDCIAFMNVYKVWTAEKANRRLNNDSVEKKWALRNFVQIKVLREVKALVSELTTRLDRLGVRESAGVNKIKWGEMERPFILKVAIAGAFYPNYFVRRMEGGKVDEQTGIKLLGGLDPMKTVYVQGWPMEQPGLLYVRRFQEVFKDCLTSSGGKIKVSFDGSSRVYVQFNETEYAGVVGKEMSRKIPLSVYKAVRMRQCNIPIEIPLLYQHEANELAEELNLLRKPLFLCNDATKDNASRSSHIKPKLPGLHVPRISMLIQYMESPGHFWIQVRSMEIKRKIDQIRSVLEESKNSWRNFDSPPEVGTLVIAPFQFKNSLRFLRATIEYYISEKETIAQVYSVDYGYTAEVRLCDLKQLENEEIASIPALAIECVLANTRPSVAFNLSETWSRPATEAFISMITKQGVLIGEIYSVVNCTIALDLIHKTEDNETNINQWLINKGFAVRKEEDYFSRLNHNLRLKHKDMSAEQCHHYEQIQYGEDYTADSYPEPPKLSESHANVKLRGPFSPLEMELIHLTTAGVDKKVSMATNSVNSVLLNSDPENPHKRLLVAGSVSQNVYSNHLTLYNTNLMPDIPGLMSLIVLIFTPHMELRRNNFGTYYIGALCGLGVDPKTKRSMFPEHDIELHFDVEITIDDLECINRMRHWMNNGMQINVSAEGTNMEEIIVCQNRIKDAFFKLIERPRKTLNSETIYNFDKWNRYNESLLLQPGRVSMVVNNIYKLHDALELEEPNEFHEMMEHLMNLRILTTEDPRNPDNMDIPCKLCNVTLTDIFDLRGHLYSKLHRDNEQKIGFKNT